MAQIRKPLRKTLRSGEALDSSRDITTFSPSSAPELTPENHRAIEKRLVSIKHQINWLTNIKNTLEYQLKNSED